jgi:hypothetical protein
MPRNHRFSVRDSTAGLHVQAGLRCRIRAVHELSAITTGSWTTLNPAARVA